MPAGNRPVTLVTGGATGLGREISRGLATARHRVVAAYFSAEEEAKDLERELGPGCAIIRMNVASRSDLSDAGDYIVNNFGRLDNLINNAGISRDGLLVRYDEEDWARVVDVNMSGCFRCMQVFAPLIARSGGGHIVNIASYAGLKGKEGQAAYSAAKAGIIGLGYTAARELAETNIRVNTVLPGYMPTAMGSAAPAAMEQARRESILGRLSDPAEVAGFIAYLCGTAGITGQVFSLDSRRA